MADERHDEFSVALGKQKDLFVTGSSCKLIPDDDMAAYINKGRHLSAWQGNRNIMIDMYDVRHYLEDLEPYEAKPVSHSPKSLSVYEEQVEILCDEERYLEFPKDFAEEEEGKRLREAVFKDIFEVSHFVYKAEESEEIISVNYNDGLSIASSPKDASDCVIPDAPGIKLNIKKMAEYVAQHGEHFEYVAKLKNNHRYEFLDPSHEYHQYYLVTKNKFLEQQELSTEAVVDHYESDVKIELQRSLQIDNKRVELDLAHCNSEHLHSQRETDKNRALLNGSPPVCVKNPALSSAEDITETEDVTSSCSSCPLEIEATLHPEKSTEDMKNKPHVMRSSVSFSLIRNCDVSGSSNEGKNASSLFQDDYEDQEEDTSCDKVFGKKHGEANKDRRSDEMGNTCNNEITTDDDTHKLNIPVVARGSEESYTYKLISSSPENRLPQELKKQLQLKRKRQAAIFVSILKRKAENAAPESYRARSSSRKSVYPTKSKPSSQLRGSNYSERSRSRSRSICSRSHSRGNRNNERSRSRTHCRGARYRTRSRSHSRERYCTERLRIRSHSKRRRYHRRSRSRSLSRGRHSPERSRSPYHFKTARHHNRSRPRSHSTDTKYLKRSRSRSWSRNENDHKRRRL